MEENLVSSLVWICACGALAALTAEAIYNVFFHPLSRFPGPKIAAAGYLYEFYYDVIKDGVYLWKIEEMHDKYGTV